MIPKIAWIHWHDLHNIPWLRAQSIRTFKKYNPTWAVNVIDTPPGIRKHGMGYAHEADWTRWRTLEEHGGFIIESDTITLAPIPDEWLDCDICAQVRKGNIYQMAALGVVPGNGLMVRLDEACSRGAFILSGMTEHGQQLGVDLLKKVTLNNVRHFGSIYNMPQDGYCCYNWNQDPFDLWTEQGPAEQIPKRAIGIHWYGGHKRSRECEETACESGKSWLERKAREA